LILDTRAVNEVSLFSLDHDQYNFASNHHLSAVQTEHQLSPSSCTAHLRSFPFPFVTYSLSRTYRLGVPLYHLQLNLPFHITSPSYRARPVFKRPALILTYSSPSTSIPDRLPIHSTLQPLPSCYFPTASILSPRNRTNNLNTDPLQVHLSLNH
jgi:hypothetical protein